jgi:hypothetical protein
MVRGGRLAAVTITITIQLLGTAAGTLHAETRVQTEIESLAATIWTGDDVALTGISRAHLDFRSTGDRNVQARLQLRLTLADMVAANDDDASTGAPAFLEVPRASIRFRFPVTETYLMRVTAGRDRLSWGLGALFNAGDLLFGADGRTAADLTRSGDVRDETAWLLSLYFPLGALGYLETVALPPLPEVALAPDGGGAAASDPDGNEGYQAAPVQETRAGLRVHGALGNVSLEPSWLYDGAAGVHRVSLSVQGSAGADVYGAASLHIPDSDGEREIDGIEGLFQEYSLLSAGAVYLLAPGYDHTISLRLEALVRPGASWSDQDERTAVYALQLYQELVWSAGRSVQMVGRGIISPMDLSTEITAGIHWNIFQGFYLLAFASGQGGGENAVYGWDRPGSLTAATGFRYLF